MIINLKKSISIFEKELSLKNQAIESSISAIALINLEGTVIYINASFLKMFGFDNKKEFLREHATRFWNDQIEATEIMETVHETGYWSGELTVTKRDGSSLITQFSANVIKNNSNEPIAIMISLMDISSHRRLEQNFETIFNSVNDGIAIFSLEGRFLEINQIICNKFGYPKDELMKMTVMDIIPPEIIESLNEQIIENLSMGGGIIETIGKRKDGSLLPVELNVRPIGYNGTAAMLAVVRNVTKRKNTEASLKASEKKYSTLVENGNDGIIIIQDDLVKFSNKKF